MQPDERDPAYLWDMLSAANEVRQIVGEMSFEQFQSDIVVMRATERCLEIIGEAARRVSETVRQSHPEISWSEIIGQRNILAHEYGQIDGDADVRMRQACTDKTPERGTGRASSSKRNAADAPAEARLQVTSEVLLPRRRDFEWSVKSRFRGRACSS